MVSDSSRPTDEEVNQLLRDNDLSGWPLNVHEGKIHAFPYVNVLMELNRRINALENPQPEDQL